MTHKFSLPTDAEIENLITQVYESLPNPDQSRLSLIESKLLRKTKKNKNNLNKIRWWIVLLLTGGFACAAWWAGEMVFHKSNTRIEDKEVIPDDKMKEYESNINNDIHDNESYEDRDTPVIYQRESF